MTITAPITPEEFSQILDLPEVIDKSTNRVNKPSKKKKPGLALAALVLFNKFQSQLMPKKAAKRYRVIFDTPLPMAAKPSQKTVLQQGEMDWLEFADGQRLPLYSFGNGPTILLVHGMSGRGSQMTDFIAPLTKAGYRAVICDLPAHGQADGKRAAFPDLARAIKKIGDHLGQLHGIIAHSNGCATTSFALSLGLQAGKVVYLAPPEDLKAHLYGMGRMLGFSKPVIALTEEMVVRDYGLPFEDVKGSNLAKNFTLPALFFHDEKDPLVPFNQSENILAKWRGAKLIKTRGLGHNRILIDPDVINATLKFL
ncbi:alpha/beta hydrolase [Sneathiella glossodoripedis]|uniref:alpha/beta hydrolase n=1 Tax=Sneathiella glossodoripedis TaxID=418853 RepID=UPI00046E7E27|nr:alpha/beta hydrolase [Sneathiella glossodoripedis]